MGDESWSVSQQVAVLVVASLACRFARGASGAAAAGAGAVATGMSRRAANGQG